MIDGADAGQADLERLGLEPFMSGDQLGDVAARATLDCTSSEPPAPTDQPIGAKSLRGS